MVKRKVCFALIFVCWFYLPTWFLVDCSRPPPILSPLVPSPTSRCNAIRCNAMRCNVTRYNTMRCNAVRYNVMRCNVMRCGAMRCNAMRCDTMRCNAVQAHFTDHGGDVMSVSILPSVDKNVFVSGSCDSLAKVMDALAL